MIAAVVLAAGESTRMGTQKLLLPYAAATVIEHIISQLSASRVDQVVVVTGFEPHRIKEHLTGGAYTFAQNDRYREGMLSSIRCGLALLGEAVEAAFVVLGDQPALQSATVDCILAQQPGNPDRVILPTHEGRRGHPILVPLSFREEIMRRFDDTGLRGLIHEHPDAILEVPVDSASILEDIDYPEDYVRALKALEESHGTET